MISPRAASITDKKVFQQKTLCWVGTREMLTCLPSVSTTHSGKHLPLLYDPRQQASYNPSPILKRARLPLFLRVFGSVDFYVDIDFCIGWDCRYMEAIRWVVACDVLLSLYMIGR